MQRPDVRLVPLAVTAWAGAWIGTAHLSSLQLLVAAGSLIVAVVGRRKPWVAATALTLLVVVCLSGVRNQQVVQSPVARLASERAVAELEVVVVTDPLPARAARFGGERFGAQARVERIEGRGRAFELEQRVYLSASGPGGQRLSRMTVGTRLRVQVRLAPADEGSRVAAWATARGSLVVISEPGAADRFVERVRGGLRAAVAPLPTEQAALVPALVVGDTSRMTDEIERDFETTGLTHLTAVSGANLTLLLAFLLTLAKWVGVRGRWLTVVGLAGVGMFIALCRTEPSVLRAAAMGLVALAALGANAESGKGLRHLSLAVMGLLLLDPWLGRSVGFALSVAASAGIIVCARSWRERMVWLPKPLAEAVTVPLSAQLATQPIVTAISGQVSVVGLVTNALAGPFVGPATVLGFATAGLSVVAPPMAAFTGWLAGWCAQAILWLAHGGAGFPGAAWRWPADPAGVLVVAGGCVAALLGMGWVLSRRWVAILTAAVMVTAVARPQTTPGWPPSQWVLAACAVGQGDAFVLRVGAGQAVVVDTGPDPELLEVCLDQLRIESVPMLVLTHYHADHIDGRSAVWGRGVQLVLVSPWASPASAAAQVRAEATSAGAAVVEGTPGQRLTVGDVGWRTLGPLAAPRSSGAEAGVAGESSAENDASIVAVAEVGGFRVLLTGDVEPSGQQALLRSGADLRADVLKVPHHGSGRQDEGFLRAAGSGIAMIGVGEENDYGHPAAKALRLLEVTGRQTLRTDTQGAIAIGGTPDRPTIMVQR